MKSQALRRVDPVSINPPARTRRRTVSLPWGRVALGVSCGIVLLFLVLPTMLVIPMSFGRDKYLHFPPRNLSLHWYGEYFGSRDWIDPTLFSLRIAALTTVVATIIGTMAALALVRGSLPGRNVLTAAFIAPVIAPAIVTALGIYSFFIRVHLTGTVVGFVLAHSVLAAPYVVLTVSAALSRFDTKLELAALSLGASRFTTAMRITLPLVLPGVLAGAAFAFITSFDEATVSFFISGVHQKTLPRKLFEDLDFNVTPTVAAVATLLTVLSLAVVGGFELLRLRSSARVERAQVAAGREE